MKKSDVCETIMSRIEGALHGLGFSKNKKAMTFTRPIEGGWQKLQIPVSNFNPPFRFGVGVAIRFDAIEELLAATLDTFTSFPEGAATYTAYGYFVGKHRYEHCVTTPDELESALAEAELIIKEKILPFLDQMASLEQCEAAINDGAVTNMYGLHPGRAYACLCAAYLVNRARFDAVAERCYAELKALDFNEVQFARVRKLAVSLAVQIRTGART